MDQESRRSLERIEQKIESLARAHAELDVRAARIEALAIAAAARTSEPARQGLRLKLGPAEIGGQLSQTAGLLIAFLVAGWMGWFDQLIDLIAALRDLR